MSERGRDVVRYLRAIEETGGYRTAWFPVEVAPGVTMFGCWAVPTADRVRAERLMDPAANVAAAMAYLRERYGDGASAGLSVYDPGVARAVDSSAVVRIFENVESEGEVVVKNDGPNAVEVSKDPSVTAAGADAFTVAANAEERVWLRPGDGLYAICAAGQSASVEVI